MYDKIHKKKINKKKKKKIPPQVDCRLLKVRKYVFGFFVFPIVVVIQ